MKDKVFHYLKVLCDQTVASIKTYQLLNGADTAKTVHSIKKKNVILENC